MYKIFLTKSCIWKFSYMWNNFCSFFVDFGVQTIDEHGTNFTFMKDERIRYTDSYTRLTLPFHPVFLLIGGIYDFCNFRNSRNLYPCVRYDKPVNIKKYPKRYVYVENMSLSPLYLKYNWCRIIRKVHETYSCLQSNFRRLNYIRIFISIKTINKSVIKISIFWRKKDITIVHRKYVLCSRGRNTDIDRKRVLRQHVLTGI